MHWHRVIQVLCVLPLAMVLLVVGCALYVHFRGKKRHTFRRQLTDHSTFLAPYNAMIYLASSVKNKPILDLADFPQLAVLRENWQMIRSEAERLHDSGDLRAAEKRNDLAFNAFFKRGWRRFYLKWYDDFLPSAQEICPKTVELLRSMPDVHAALFALLPAGAKLGEHRDPFAGSLRYHLGLITPNSDRCKIFVDGIPYSWRDGEAVLFDETYIHSAENDTEQDRLILFCDVARPMWNPLARLINYVVVHTLIKATAAQNRETEKIGFLNRFSGYFYKLGSAAKSLKKKNRKLYKRLNLALNVGVIGVVLGITLWLVLRKW